MFLPIPFANMANSKIVVGNTWVQGVRPAFTSSFYSNIIHNGTRWALGPRQYSNDGMTFIQSSGAAVTGSGVAAAYSSATDGSKVIQLLTSPGGTMSPNGGLTAWAANSMGSFHVNTSLVGIAYGEGYWVTVASRNNTSADTNSQCFRSSTDGSTWTATYGSVPTTSTASASSIIYHPSASRFVAILSSNCHTSDNGTTWTSRGAIPGSYASQQSYIPYMNMSMGIGNVSGVNRVGFSADGINFVSYPTVGLPLATTAPRGKVAICDGYIILAYTVGSSTTFYRSYDGITWTNVATIGSIITSVYYYNGMIVAAGYNASSTANLVWYSVS